MLTRSSSSHHLHEHLLDLELLLLLLLEGLRQDPHLCLQAGLDGRGPMKILVVLRR